MKKTTILISLLIASALILGACTAPVAEEAPAEEAVVEEEVMEEEAVEAPAEEETLEEAKGGFDETILADEAYDIALVVKNNTSPFWASHVEGAKAAGADLGVNITTHAPEKQEDINLQIAILEDLITAEVDCVAIAPANTEGITAGIVKLNDAGIPVVYDNTMGPDTEPYLTYVGIDNYDVGVQMGNYVADLMGEEGNVLILEGVQGQSTSDQRSSGARDAFASYPNITVASYATNWDATQFHDDLLFIGFLCCCMSAASGSTTASLIEKETGPFTAKPQSTQRRANCLISVSCLRVLCDLSEAGGED